MRRRIWVEGLPASELGAPATTALLARFGLAPLIALPPAAETPALARALAALTDRGLEVGLWPLLEDAEGYWPSAENAELFAARVARALAFARAARVPIRTVAIDLEPPLPLTRALFRGPSAERARLLAQRWRVMRVPPVSAAWAPAEARYQRLVAELEAAGIETLAAVVPPVVLDLAAGTTTWSQIFGTPAWGPAWAVVSPMMYSSLLEAMVPGWLPPEVLIHEAGRRLSALGPGRASLSLGLVGTGKLEHEPVLDAPEHLARDVGAARAAGIDDLALYALEGVLAREAPEAWLRAFCDTPPAAPPRARRALVAGVTGALTWAQGRLGRAR